MEEQTRTTQRKYSVAEIDRMRRAIEFQYLHGFRMSQMRGGSFTSRPFYQNEKEVAVEQRLRTYLLAGVDPEELE